MQQITIASPEGEKLCGAAEQVVLCDAEGRVLGFFSPLKNRPRIEDLQLEPALSIAQTEELRKKNRDGKPLEEILGRLGF